MNRAATKKVLTVIALLGVHPMTAHAQTEGFTITGTVVDKSTGNPLQYAVVGFPGQQSWALSDQNGGFELTEFEGGLYRFMVLRRGFYYADQNFRLAGPRNIEVEMTPVDASLPVGPGRVVGRVLDQASGQPIEDAWVGLAPTSQQAETDARGRFEITDVSAGALLLQVRREGYQPRLDTIVAFPGVTVDVEVTLATTATPLESITIVTRSPFLEMVGFYRRAGRGWQANRTAIEAVDPPQLEGMFHRVAAVRVGRDQFDRTVLTSKRGTRCAFGVFLDGMRTPGLDINALLPDAVEALEVYQGPNVPPEYSDPCGAVLLWTRQNRREVGPGRVVGRVLDQASGRPIEGVSVALAATAQQTETDSRGRFEITDVSTGVPRLELRRVGYQPRLDPIAVFSGVTVDVEVTLATAAIPLESITIVARSPFLEGRGFYRRAGGSGWQANRTAIEAGDSRDLERMFDRVGAIRVERSQFGGTVLTSRGGTRCAFGVFLDGIRAPGFDINTLPPDAVEALEVYQGLNAPPEYSDSCGAVLIWMRRSGQEEFRTRDDQ